jgi:hypothetical protein
MFQGKALLVRNNLTHEAVRHLASRFFQVKWNACLALAIQKGWQNWQGVSLIDMTAMHAGMTNDYQLPTANLVYDNPGSDLERLIPNSKCQMAEPEFSLPETCNIYDFVNESDCGCDPMSSQTL